MDWKDFFKPAIGKTILFIIFFLIFPSNFIDLASISEGPQTQFIPLFGGFVTIIGVLNNLGVGISVFTNVDVVFFIFSLVVSYILSCVISYIYYKYKKEA